MISQFIGCVSVTVCLILVVIVYWRIYIILKRHKNQIEELQIQEVQQGVQNGDLSNFLKLRKSALGTFYACIVLDLLFAFLYSLFFIHGSPFKFNLLLQCLAPYNDFVFPQLVFEPCYLLLEDGTHSSRSHGQ